jgi:hypothetical protein
MPKYHMQIEKILYFLKVKKRERKGKERTPLDEPTVPI